jgi:hypothetical protein
MSYGGGDMRHATAVWQYYGLCAKEESIEAATVEALLLVTAA